MEASHPVFLPSAWGLVFGGTGHVESAGIALRSLFCGSPPPEAKAEVSKPPLPACSPSEPPSPAGALPPSTSTHHLSPHNLTSSLSYASHQAGEVRI